MTEPIDADRLVRLDVVGDRSRHRHWTCNTFIEGDGERATARSFLLSLRPGRAPQPGPTAVYHDRLRKTATGWRIEYRMVEFEEAPDWPAPVS